jgi:hypothetical protein
MQIACCHAAAAAAATSRLHLQTKDNKKDADSTVEEEIRDNLYFVIKNFRFETDGEDPILVMDNVNIQAGVPDDWVESRYGDFLLPAGCRLRIPTHSPDFNQVAEHFIALVKRETRNMVYQRCIEHGRLQETSMQWMVEVVFNKIKKGELYKGSVAANVQRMPLVWRVISSSKQTVVTDPCTGRQYKGTAGNWAPPGLN